MIPYLDLNALIYLPYARVNCLTTIPFTAAHTYIAHKWQYPPPPGAYPGFYSMKRLGVFVLQAGWDASPSQGYARIISHPLGEDPGQIQLLRGLIGGLNPGGGGNEGGLVSVSLAPGGKQGTS